MSDWSLRLARGEDASLFPDIERSAAEAFSSFRGLETLAVAWPLPVERHRLLIAKGHCLTALVDDAIAGFLVAERFGRSLHIWEMSVAQKHQQAGIGSGLLRACGVDAANCGCDSLTLTTFADVPWNAPFYRSHGFETVTDLAPWPRLAELLESESDSFRKMQERVAMVRFL